VDAMNKKYGNLYFKDVIPKTTYKGMEKDNNVISVANILVTSPKMSEKDAYNIVKAVFDNKIELVRTHYEYISVTLAGQKSASTPIPFHPGALKYFKEKNIKVN
jgi:TRAP transporter TAXI family solute receptor